MAKLGDLKVRIRAETKAFARAMGQAKKLVSGLGSSVKSLSKVGLVGGATGIFAAKELLAVGDAYVNLDARLTNLTGDAKTAADVQEQLFQMSQRTGTAVLANANAFTKLQLAQSMTGKTADENLEILEAINKIFALSGANALDASIAMRQLGQALASGRLQGDEFRSISEAAPGLMVELAKELGVATGALKKMGSEGELTSDILSDAFLNIARTSELAFKEIPVTSDRAFTRIVNSLQKVWDNILDNTELIPFIADQFDQLASWIEANSPRFVDWAIQMKEWIITNWPEIKSQVLDLFVKTKEAIIEIAPAVIQVFGIIKTLSKEILPVISQIINAITTAIRFWKEFFDISGNTAEREEILAKGRIEREIAENQGAGAEGAAATPRGNATVINNNISEKFSRSDLARLNTDQERQAARA